jgi:hypothetical protein
MTKGNKTRSQLILDALLTGKTLLLSDIRRMVSEASGKDVRLGDISSLMTKLTNPRQYRLAHLIIRNKNRKGYGYSLVPEILALAPEEVHGLTRKIGKDRFTLEMAVEKIPELAKYLKKGGKAVGKKPSASRKKVPAKKPRVTKVKSKAKAVKVKTGRKALPVPVQKAGVENVVAGFLHEMDKMGGLRVNFYLAVRLLKG